ncbi:hypothetical protein TrVE_jg10681 [Triparma verrucosa]|uniref:CRAL-TRIO domain-containing protein n=1 Tax=Triparma verrucosa TaxID=1606542 RepID=A0A9W7B971_9STRA|nr:hypothetical protein TrVE_jg10681 [Triparma verrucosa]
MNPTSPPSNFLRACNNDAIKASQLWSEHIAWRDVASIGTIHQRPHPHFNSIKKAYPHFIHGHSKNGLPVTYELCGKMNLKPLFSSGLRVPDMLHHLVYTNEYITNVLRPLIKPSIPPSKYSPENGCIVIMDVSGLSLSQLNGDLITYLSSAGKMVNCHYPGFQKRTIIVNAPLWFKGAWGGVSKFMSKEVRDAASVCGRDYGKVLREYIDGREIPKEYGGESESEMMGHFYEEGLKKFVGEVEGGGEEYDEVKTEDDVESKVDAPPSTPKRLRSHSFDPRHFMFSAKLDRWIPDEGFDSPKRFQGSQRLVRGLSFEDDTIRRPKRGGSYGGSRVFDGILLVILLVLFLWTAYT